MGSNPIDHPNFAVPRCELIVRSFATFFAIAVVFTISRASAAPTATTGIAYDAVTLHLRAGASPQPLPFDDLFDAVVPSEAPVMKPTPSHGKSSHRDLRALARSGSAERFFFIVGHERIEDFAANTSTIVDCEAGSITRLDNKKKTYRITALAASPSPEDTHVNMNVSSQSLGALLVDGSATEGFALTMQTTATIPVSPAPRRPTPRPGQLAATMKPLAPSTIVNSFSARSYFSGYAQPKSCLHPALPQRADAADTEAPLAMEALLGHDPRYAMTLTGTQPPFGNIVLFQVIVLPAHPGGVIVTQVGHYRTITAADATLFAIPPDYTQER